MIKKSTKIEKSTKINKENKKNNAISAIIDMRTTQYKTA